MAHGPLPGAVTMAGGEVVIETLDSEILKGNPLGDPTRRDVAIYLPPRYDPTKRYPAAYGIVGYTGTGKMLLGVDPLGEDLKSRLDGYATTQAEHPSQADLQVHSEQIVGLIACGRDRRATEHGDAELCGEQCSRPVAGAKLQAHGRRNRECLASCIRQRHEQSAFKAELDLAGGREEAAQQLVRRKSRRLRRCQRESRFHCSAFFDG